MGNRGPARTPTKLLKMRESDLRYKRTNEPEPVAKMPEPPEWLSDEALREWSRIAVLLEPLHYVSEVDRAMLTAYCQNWADYVAAVEAGDERRKDATFARLLRSSGQLGLTPATRSQCQVIKGKQTKDGKVSLGQTG